MIHLLLSLLLLFTSASVVAEEVTASFVKLDNDFFEKPDPAASQWDQPTKMTVQLFPQNITTPSVYEASVATLDVKAMHNGKWLAVLLSWDDSKKDFHVSHDHFSDACAIQFPTKGAESTSPFMGNKEAPVAIMHWKAIWQEDVDQHYQTVTDLYPNTWVDTYRFGKSVAIDAKNPVSQTERKSPVEELIAEGFGTLTTQQHQNANGNGLWKEGKWYVVFTRPLNSKDKQDPNFKAGQKTSIAFALWEGSHKNVGARKNYAPWVPLVLEKK